NRRLPHVHPRVRGSRAAPAGTRQADHYRGPARLRPARTHRQPPAPRERAGPAQGPRHPRRPGPARRRPARSRCRLPLGAPAQCRAGAGPPPPPGARGGHDAAGGVTGERSRMERLRLAVVGVGHLGKEHARILAGLSGVELVGVVDARAEQAEVVARRCSTRPFTDHRQLLAESLDAAVIAVPTIHHHAVAADYLRAGVALLVEKPLASTLAQADELVDLARRVGVLLQVGHVERFNPAFEQLSRRPLQPKLVTCQRLSPFSGRSLDIGVVLDLMIHDLDLLLALVSAPVRDVSAVGLSLLSGHEDFAQAYLTFESGCVAHLSASRAHTAPVR